jgi:hypothetical protein
MVIYHIDMVILDVDMGYGLMIWEMIVSIWDILSLWRQEHDCPWDNMKSGSAVVHGQVEGLRWALDHGCPWRGWVISDGGNTFHGVQ